MNFLSHIMIHKINNRILQGGNYTYMVNTFEIVGKLSISKENEKFKPYEVTEYPSGWTKSRLLFNVQSAQNRHMLSMEGMYKADGTGKVYTFTKGSVNPTTHERIKGENIQVPWKDRNKPEVLENVAEFKKFVVDLEKTGRRYKLQHAADGNLPQEELDELGVEDVEKALEDSKKKRKEFISEYDFTEYLQKLISSGKIDGRLFRVLGNIVHSEYNGKIYKKLVPQRLYLADNGEEEVSNGQITVYFNKGSLDTASYDATKKYYINGFVRDYDGNRKENIPCPILLTLDDSHEDEKKSKVVKVIKKQFEVDDSSWKEFGVKVKLLDGAQKVEITEEMLTDFQKEMLELEAITMDEIRKEIGGDVYGEKTQEMIIVNVAKGFTKGRKDTVFVDSDFVVKQVEPKETKQEETATDDDDLGLDDLDDIL
jgi:hypothetical protein